MEKNIYYIGFNIQQNGIELEGTICGRKSQWDNYVEEMEWNFSTNQEETNFDGMELIFKNSSDKFHMIMYRK